MSQYGDIVNEVDWTGKGGSRLYVGFELRFRSISLKLLEKPRDVYLLINFFITMQLFQWQIHESPVHVIINEELINNGWLSAITLMKEGFVKNLFLVIAFLLPTIAFGQVSSSKSLDGDCGVIAKIKSKKNDLLLNISVKAAVKFSQNTEKELQIVPSDLQNIEKSFTDINSFAFTKADFEMLVGISKLTKADVYVCKGQLTKDNIIIESITNSDSSIEEAISKLKEELKY